MSQRILIFKKIPKENEWNFNGNYLNCLVVFTWNPGVQVRNLASDGGLTNDPKAFPLTGSTPLIRNPSKCSVTLSEYNRRPISSPPTTTNCFYKSIIVKFLLKLTEIHWNIDEIQSDLIKFHSFQSKINEITSILPENRWNHTNFNQNLLKCWWI